MTTKEIVETIDKVIAGIETDRFTMENLQVLKSRIIKEAK